MKKEIIWNGYIATLRQASKEHRCATCLGPIIPGFKYYEVIRGGGGMGWKKFPDRYHTTCLEKQRKFKEVPSGNT